MGSGFSNDIIEKQEKIINEQYNNIKKYYPEYSVLQIKGKLRNEYNNNNEKNAFILDHHWNRHLKS